MATHITETTTIHEDSVSVFSSPGANMIAGSPLRSGMAVGVQQGVQRGPTYGANLSSPMWASNRGGPAGGQMGMGMQMGMQSGMQMSYSQQTQGYSQTQSSPNRGGGGFMQAASAPVREAEDIKYIEIPVVQEVLKKIPKREIITIERKVPVVTYEYVDKVVEVPEIHYVDKVVEVPQSREVVVRVPIIEYVEVEREVIRTVPKINVKKVEKPIDVPGDIIEVEKPYTVENKIVVPRYEKVDVVVVVAQRIHPFLFECDQLAALEVTVFDWEPTLKLVEIFIPKPISRTMVAGKMDSKHQLVEVTAAQWNSLVFNCNSHVRDENDLKDILICSADLVPTVQGPGTFIVHPICDVDVLLVETTKFSIHVSEADKTTALVDLAERPNFAKNANNLERSPQAEEILASRAMQGGRTEGASGSASFFASSPMSFAGRTQTTSYGAMGGSYGATQTTSYGGGMGGGMSSSYNVHAGFGGMGNTQMSTNHMDAYTGPTTNTPTDNKRITLDEYERIKSTSSRPMSRQPSMRSAR